MLSLPVLQPICLELRKGYAIHFAPSARRLEHRISFFPKIQRVTGDN